MSRFFWIILLIHGSVLFAQFPPAAGLPGSTAIHRDSGDYIDWAKTCEVVRGLEWAADSAGPKASFGEPGAALGPSNGSVVSLGDGGYALLSFDPPIANGPGFDFAVFENAFSDTYLELAFVEVSSDGERFVRFPSESLTDTLNQVGTFGLLNPTQIHNLAGKYRIFWGTPFDLEELSDSHGLDLNQIRYVRIVDVVGSISDSFAQRDANGRKINDPYPTAFESGGFDLDAVGVIHNSLSTQPRFPQVLYKPQLSPNPVSNHASFTMQCAEPFAYKICDSKGTVYSEGMSDVSKKVISAPGQVGIYFIHVSLSDSQYTLKLIVH